MAKARYPQRNDGYRSKLEAAVATDLKGQSVDFEYESLTVPFVQPAKDRRYTPDFILANGIVIETKGHFKTDDRQKHLMVRDSWPGLDIRFVFSRSSTRLNKRSKTTYAKWCKDHGFLYAGPKVPLEWILENANEESLAALEEIRQHRPNL